MIHSKSASAGVIGLALFSMFFGAGNLIFPMAVGAFAEGHYPYGTLGFLITAVFLPFLGVFTMVLFRGDYTRFFSILGRPLGFFFTLLLLTFWIPLGSGPRCVTLAFAAARTFVPDLWLWPFSLGFCVLIYALTYRENNIIGLLGKVLTPALLISIVFVVVAGLLISPGLAAVEHVPSHVFTFALSEGYNTQDLIASFFFSSAIIGILNHTDVEGGASASERRHLTLALRGGLIGVAVLGIVYVGLLYLGAAYSSVLQEVSKDSLLSHLSVYLLGHHMGFVPVAIIALACVTTSVALTIVFAKFLKTAVFKDYISEQTSLIMTLVLTFCMSLLGFESISEVLGVAMAWLYPALIILMVVNLILYYYRRPNGKETATVATSRVKAV